MTYSEKLKNPRWQKKRLYVLNRDEWKCRLCGDTESALNVHHLKYSGEPWDAPDDCLITYCEDCHRVAEFGKEDGLVFIDGIKKMLNDVTIIVTIDANGVFYMYSIVNGYLELMTVINQNLLSDIINMNNRNKKVLAGFSPKAKKDKA